MRALPGRASRTSAGSAPAAVTRSSVSEDQRQRILRATGELVAKRGYDGVTVELIVKRARVSFKTFYKHFRGKEDCFLELFDSFMGAAQHQIDAAVAAHAAEPWPEQVIAALRVLYDAIIADPLVARATIVEAPTVGPIIVSRYEAAMKGLVPLLLRGREQSPAAAALPSTLEDTLAGGVLWSAYQRLIVGEVDRIDALLPESAEFLLRPYLGEAEAAQWVGALRDGAGSAPAT